MATILLLEPDKSLASSYAKVLEHEGFSVVHCVEIHDAIQKLDAQPIDLIVLELQIALHNGLEFLYEMRSYSEWQKIPVVLHTSVPQRALDQGDVLKKELNVHVHLYKPTTSLAKLVETVNSCLLAQNI